MCKFLLAIIAFLMIAGCKKEDSGLTDVSEKGEYFNCRINGQYWTYKQANGLFGAVNALSSYQLYDVPSIITHDVIRANNVVDYPQTEIELNMDHEAFLAGDTIMLGNNPSRLLSGKGLSWAEITNPNGLTDSIHTGRVIFTQRTDEWQRGIFEFTVSDGQGSQFSVTEGRFAISLK